MQEFVPAAENWEAIYYPNPIPLSSRSLLAMALLFDRVHVPGVSLPIAHATDAERAEILEWVTDNPEVQSERNLWLWAIEYPVVADFIYLPDVDLSGEDLRALQKTALSCLMTRMVTEHRAGLLPSMPCTESCRPIRTESDER